MKHVVVYLPAVFLDALQPGEWHEGAIACIDCGVVQPVGDVRLRWCCASPSCTATSWIELAHG